MARHFGWIRNDAGVEAEINSPENRHPIFGVSGRAVMDSHSKETTLLYPPILECLPNWRRISQGIGDCVSHGAELAALTLLCLRAKRRGHPESVKHEVATEPIYGGARVEALGYTRGGWRDGSYGAAAAKWLREYGVILRKDYSRRTGNPEHDLREYSASKAKQWGNYGCGGRDDKGKLDEVARLHPIKTTSLVTNFDELAAAVAGSLSPVTIASNVGFGNEHRNNDGFVRRRGVWHHQMVVLGVRFDKPGGLIFNSHGASASGPHWPSNMPEVMRECSWWATAEDLDAILRQDDSWAFGDAVGWKLKAPDWQKLGRLE